MQISGPVQKRISEMYEDLGSLIQLFSRAIGGQFTKYVRMLARIVALSSHFVLCCVVLCCVACVAGFLTPDLTGKSTPRSLNISKHFSLPRENSTNSIRCASLCVEVASHTYAQDLRTAWISKTLPPDAVSVRDLKALLRVLSESGSCVIDQLAALTNRTKTADRGAALCALLVSHGDRRPIHATCAVVEVQVRGIVVLSVHFQLSGCRLHQQLPLCSQPKRRARPSNPQQQTPLPLPHTTM